MSSSALQNWLRWWKRERHANESLANFLLRQEIVTADTLACLEESPEEIAEVNPRYLLAHGALDILRMQMCVSSQPVNTDTAERAGATVTAKKAKRRNYQTGESLGHCQLLNCIGQGAFGAVYRAIHKTLGISVAVKVLSVSAEDETISERCRELLAREAHLLARLSHPSIIRVLDFDHAADAPYLVMELVDGISLAEMIDQSGGMRPDLAARMFVSLCDALEVFRRAGILHHDVKPANILVSREGVAKIADLGLGALLEPGETAISCGLGTPLYISPEQATPGTAVDSRSDLYSLGVTLYESVTGRPPFLGKTAAEILQKHVEEAPVVPCELRPTIPAELSDIIMKLLAKTPTQRYQTASEVSQALRRFLAKSKDC
jgi:serine/threonine-protein kinase